MRLAVVNHHGGTPGGSENSLLGYVERLPPEIEPVFLLFEGGAFADRVLSRYPASRVVPMTARMATTTRANVGPGVAVDALGFVGRVAGVLRETRADVVLTNSVKAHFVGSLAARLAGKPCVNYVHDLLEGRGRLAIRTLSRLTARERIVCSRRVARSLDLPRTRVVYAPMDVAAVDPAPDARAARRRLGLPDDGLPIVGLVGRFAPWKGQDRFIRIAERVLREIDARFAIVGGAVFGCDPAYPEALRASVAASGLAERVHFVPWQDRMDDVYAALDVGCNCSVREPFGMTTLEAQLRSVPVVCFDDAGVCEVFTDGVGGRQIPADDEAAYAAALVAYLRDPDLRRRHGAAARREAEAVDVRAQLPTFVGALRAAAGRTP